MNDTAQPRPPTSDTARIVLRPLGNPLPLGFLGLAAGTLLLSGLQLAWLRPTDGQDVALILIAFVFPLQLLAATLGYLARYVVAGTGMGVLAGTRLSIGLITLTGKPGATSDALGLFLLLAATAMLIPAAAATTGKLVPAAVLTTTALRFAITGLYQLTDSNGWKELAGIVGLVLCALALYAALAMAIEDARHTTVLPLGRRSLGRSSLDADFPAQLQRLAREAGVREQL
jgi:uncharacterized protein